MPPTAAIRVPQSSCLRRCTPSCIEWRNTSCTATRSVRPSGHPRWLHEAYLDIAARDPGFPDRARFFAYTARAMRGLIIDHVRERRALKRGGEFHLTALNTEIAESASDLNELGPLDDALNELAHVDHRSPSSSI